MLLWMEARYVGGSRVMITASRLRAASEFSEYGAREVFQESGRGRKEEERVEMEADGEADEMKSLVMQPT
jgi:hypothetical protein